MVLHLFWFTATVQIAMAIGFALLVRKVPTARGLARQVRLANAQRKDDWLACGIIWLGIFSDDVPLRLVVLVAGGITLAWLSQRTRARIRLLQG
jgi:ABC-type sugar transport system permease subunit